jgi:hypothetical protein
LTGSAEQHVDVGAAGQDVVAGAAEQQVVPRAAIGPQPDGVRREASRIDDVVAGERIDRRCVVAGFGVREVDRGGEAEDAAASRCCRRRGSRRRVGAHDDRPVGLTVAGVAAPEVGVGGRDVGAGEVVDRDRVGAAERGVVDPLHVVEVHNGAGKVAEEAHALAVGGRVDRFGGGRAVEAQSVGAGLVLDRVVVVTGVPDERLVALCRFGRYAERFPGSPAKRRSRARKIGITLGRPVNATPLVTVWRSLRKPGCRLYGRLLLVDTRSSALPSTSRPLSAGRRA